MYKGCGLVDTHGAPCFSQSSKSTKLWLSETSNRNRRRNYRSQWEFGSPASYLDCLALRVNSNEGAYPMEVRHVTYYVSR